MDSNKAASGEISFSGLLLIAFIVLRLTNVIKWSWLWVLAPLWMPIVLFVIFIAAVTLINK